MSVKKPVKKPTKKEIDEAAASVEAAIEKLEVEEVEVEIKEPEEKIPEKTEEKEEVAEETVEEKVPVEDTVSEEETKSEEKNGESLEEALGLNEKKDEQTAEEVGVFSKSPFEKEAKGGKSKLIITICLIIIFTILGFFGGYFYGKSGTTGTGSVSKALDITPTEEPTPTEAEVDLSEYSIEILNGSGVAGVAGDAQTTLETDGFNVENTGNAENQDFTETVIAVKEDVPSEFVTLLRNSLEETYVVESGTEELDADSDYDVVVIIGSETVVDE